MKFVKHDVFFNTKLLRTLLFIENFFQMAKSRQTHDDIAISCRRNNCTIVTTLRNNNY